jgi:acyl-CoA synthetase (AMP-forming)/AMP-acid ligase II
MTDDAIEAATNVVDLFRRRVGERGDAPAVTVVADDVGAPVTVSYAELDRRARAVAALLRHRTPGDRVVLLFPSGPDFVAAFLGALYAGMVVVPAPLPGRYAHQRRRVSAIAADSGARTVLTGTADLEVVRDWARQEPTDVDVLDIATPTDGDPFVEPTLTRTDLAMLQYTSGSTGDPKGVMVSHGNLLHNVGSLGRAMGFTGRTRFGGWIPLYHDMGLIGQLLPALFFGSECVLMSPTAFLKRPVHWLTLIDRYDINYSAAPNFAFEQCVHGVTDEQVATLDLSRWTHSANGSEPIRAQTLLAFAKRFAPAGYTSYALAPCYGLAEATVFVSGRGGREAVSTRVDADALERHEFRPVGPATPGMDLVGCGTAHDFDVRVVDPTTRAIAGQGRIGEIWLRGASVTIGYWRNPTATAAVFGATTAEGETGFLRTGDLGIVHDGELYVTGRIKETLIIRGRNLYPQDIEHEIRAQHPELRPVVGAAFGVSAPTEHIVVIHEVRGRPDEARLRELATSIRLMVTREFGVRPAGVVLLRPGSVRRTTSGKIQRTEMRTLFLSGGLNPVYEAIDPAIAAIRQPGAAGDG